MLGAPEFRKHFSNTNDAVKTFHTANKSVIYNVDTLNTSITSGKKVLFDYYEYDLCKQMKKRKQARYLVNPYQMVFKNGFYYLIGNYDKYDNISNYRVDRIKNVEITNAEIKPKPADFDSSLSQYMAEHLYMFSGESVDAVMRVDKCIKYK